MKNLKTKILLLAQLHHWKKKQSNQIGIRSENTKQSDLKKKKIKCRIYTINRLSCSSTVRETNRVGLFQ